MSFLYSFFCVEMQHQAESSVNSSVALVEAKYNKLLNEKEKQLKEFIQKHDEVSNLSII